MNNDTFNLTVVLVVVCLLILLALWLPDLFER